MHSESQPGPQAGAHPQQAPAGFPQPQQAPARTSAPPQQQQQDPAIRGDPKLLVSSMFETTNPLEIPKDLYDIVPNLKIFDKLLQCEKNIDKLLAKKRIDIQEQLSKPLCRTKRILRIHVFNNHANQGNMINSENPPYWIVRVQAKLLNQTQGTYPRKFSYFVQRLQVAFDKADYPSFEDVNWKKSSQSAELDGFEIKRFGNKETTLKIVLYPFNFPQKFKLEPKLADILGINNCTRVQVFTAIWEYIKLHKLQDKENRNIINNDLYFKEIFGTEKMTMDQISLKLRELLGPIEPITLYHRVKLSGDCKGNETIHDIEVDLDYFTVSYDVMPFFAQKITTDEKMAQQANKDQNLLALNQKLKKLDRKCADYIEKLKRHKSKRDAYEAYQKDPSLFIDNLILQQNNYLKVMHDDEIDQIEDPKKLGFLLENEDLIEREIRNYLKEREEANV